MRSGSESIQRLLGALAKHGELVAEAFEGPVSGGDRSRDAAIGALVDVNALRPYEEDAYYLNPRLYDFIADHLVSYQAFQALTRLTAFLHQAKVQWNELVRLRASGAQRDAGKLEIAFDRSVIGIASAIERNLMILHSMVSTQYGNVEDIQSKLRQNNFYRREVNLCIQETESVSRLFEEIANQAIAAGMPHMRQLVLRRIDANMLQWSSRLKDAQNVISRRLFEAKRMEARLKQLSRYAEWLSTNKTADGWDIDANREAPPSLLRPAAPNPWALRPQPDVKDDEERNARLLQEAATRLPKKKDPYEQLGSEVEQQAVIADEMEEIEVVLEAHEQALQALIEHLQQQPPEAPPMSLLGWKQKAPGMENVSDEEWLLYAAVQLSTGDLVTSFITEHDPDPFPMNEAFYDVEVRRMVPAAMQA
ncbi:hypothetical protein ABIC83_002918 [Roseateles asaccharophilus]|uniref:hypothetical protein n=1 Tax=Roseateles asaccharophilus TaxID=582607 RepID=UPI003833340F